MDAREVAVKGIVGSIVIGPLILIGTMPVIAGQPVSSGAPVVAAAGASASDRDAYVHKAQDDLQEWRQKLDAFDASLEASGKVDTAATQHDLHDAWIETQAEAEKLQTASAEDWDSVKISYEQAVHKLAAAWDGKQSGGKQVGVSR
jgi:capsule polysaccharide export protein KpsE/RkpR